MLFEYTDTQVICSMIHYSGTKVKPIDRSQLPKASATVIKMSMRSESEMKYEEGQGECEGDAVEIHMMVTSANSHRGSRTQTL